MSLDAERFFKSIGLLTQQQVEAARQDKTIVAKIISVENADAGKYKVEYEGNKFFANSTNPTIVYRTGEQVYVLVPQSDFSAEKVILGYSNYTDNTDKSQGLKNFYVDVGPNWVDKRENNDWAYQPYYFIDSLAKEQLGIVATPNDEVNNINHNDNNYGANWENIGFSRSRIFRSQDSNNLKNLKIQYPQQASHPNSHYLTEIGTADGDAEVTAMGRSYEYVKISGEFHTQFLKQHFKGTYALRVVLLVSKQLDESAISTVNDYEEKVLELGFANFTGAPYNYNQWTKQTAYFQVPKGSIRGLKEVSLVQDGNFEIDYPQMISENAVVNNTDNKLSVNNIFVRNIEIRFAEKINLIDTQWYTYVETPRGTRLSTNVGSIELIPHLLNYGEDIFDPATCEVYWFREKLDITIADVNEDEQDEHNITWFDVGGNGWYPISKIIANQDCGETINEQFHSYYTITNEGHLIIEKEAVPWQWRYKLVIIYRETTEDEYKEVGRFSPNNPVVVTRADSIYDLSLETFIQHLDTTFLRIKGTRANPAADSGWKGTYWLERIDGSYFQISGDRVTTPQDITQYLAQAIARFHVQCYDPNSTGNDPEIANLMLDCINSDEIDLLVTWSGRSTFHYDAAGKIKTWTATMDNVIKPTLKWLQDGVDAYSIEVRGPGNQILGFRQYLIQDANTDTENNEYYTTNGVEDTFENDESMMTGMYLDQDYCIHFKIREQYDEARTDNTFKLKIKLSSQPEPYYVEKEIIFVKDGDQGTIGGEWIAPIYPCNFIASSNEERYVEKLDSQQTVPLVVHMDNNVAWQQNNHFRLALRPFVCKNGKPIESLDPSDGYFYQCYWDVRTPSFINNEKAKYASFLRLYSVTDNGLGTVDNNFRPIDSFNPNWTMANGTMITPKTNPDEQQSAGLVAYTSFKNEDGAKNNYGAIEVRFFDNAKNGTTATIADILYRFVVKCQIEIFKGSYDSTTNEVDDTERQRVATITSFYPVDMVFTNQGIGDEYFYARYKEETHPLYGFDKRMQLNWPQYVQYDATGGNPIFRQDKDGLYLVVSDGDITEATKYLAQNLTPSIQEIKTTDNKQTYKPFAHLTMIEGFTGAIRTIPGSGFFGDGDNTSYFVRNQIMYLNAYGNVDINGWDGQGIDINEEDSTVFATTMGAGFKVPTTNLFTGVLMGVDKSQKRNEIDGFQGTYDSDYVKDHPYLTGLFGYQDGVSSFALYENGTGFFGRADKGGRIIFDGSHATLYGGNNTSTIESPALGDNMWNRMRLTLADLSHSSQGTSIKNANGSSIIQGFGDAYFEDPDDNDQYSSYRLPKWYKTIWQNAYIKPNGRLPYWYDGTEYDDLPQYGGSATGSQNYKLNYYDPESNATWVVAETDKIDTDNNNRYDWIEEFYASNADGSFPDDYASADDTTEHPNCPFTDKELQGRTYRSIYKAALNAKTTTNIHLGFGANRASTTPAIEIGQHIEGLMPGILDWNDYETVFRNLKIPGNRNFMVTYDGTLWAMNGIFMGAVIGSNIIGGRLQGAEIGIGKINTIDTPKIYQVSRNTESPGSNANSNICQYSVMVPPKETETDFSDIVPDGATKCAFYVSKDGQLVAKNIYIYGGNIDIQHFHIQNNGHLVQNAESDFIGETHFFGNVSISPDEGTYTGDDNATTSVRGSKLGNLFQTKGRVALGILEDQHSTMVNNYWKRQATTLGLTSYKTYEDKCVFGIDSVAQINESVENYYSQGHFWPLAFKTIPNPSTNTAIAYVTVMDKFQHSGALSTHLGSLPASNYFRIGYAGVEAESIFIRSNFLGETATDNVTGSNYKGWVGLVPSSNQPSIENTSPAAIATGLGLVTQGKAPIILSADGNLSLRSAGAINLMGANRGVNEEENTNLTNASSWRFNLVLGGGSNNTSHFLNTVKTGLIGVAIYTNKTSLTAEEAYTAPEASGSAGWYISVNNEDKGKIKVWGIEPENQEGIYARFA